MLSTAPPETPLLDGSDKAYLVGYLENLSLIERLAGARIISPVCGLRVLCSPRSFGPKVPKPVS